MSIQVGKALFRLGTAGILLPIVSEAHFCLHALKCTSATRLATASHPPNIEGAHTEVSDPPFTASYRD
jgi:hypothetical protein